MQRFLGGLLALFALVGVAHGQDQSDLLPVEQAFQLRYDLTGPGQIALHWDIAPDYYLYRGRISAKTDQTGLSLGELQLPPGEPQHDEFFGDVEIYHGAVDATLPYTLTDAADSISLAVTVQGCHEVDPKVCYPPHRTLLTLSLPQAAVPAGLPAFNGGAGLQLGQSLTGGVLGASNEDEALPAEQAFVFEAIAMGPGEILARWSMPHGYYLYRDKTRVDVIGNGDVLAGEPDWPASVDHVDDNFGAVRVYYNQLELPVSLKRASGDAQTITLRGEFQGCKENGICYPIMQRELQVDLPVASIDELAVAAASFVPALAPAESDQNALRSVPPSLTTGALLLALLLALLGGVILNLMPCVLPVLSLKVLGLAQSGDSAPAARRHALFYTAGVLTAFAAVGLLAIALRAAGQALGWGFQLQQPAFVAVLVYVMFAVGLGLSGVFNFGASLAGSGQKLTARSGPAGDFFTGVLACVVASPCTAPFMGPALAFAFAASPWVALLIFLALGLGLALPFLLIGFVPALARRLPRPGAWMDTFKQVLAFPMYLTAVWLVWVLGKQRGADAIGLVLAGAVVLALALWWFERARYRSGWLRAAAIAVLLLALLPVYQVSQLPPPAAAGEAADDRGALTYSPERLATLRGEGRTVFVNMTADWCATCKVNEKTVLGSDDFRALLESHDAVYMKGDWTNVDPQITAFLEQHKSVGVPLYVVFHGQRGEGKVLPTVLTSTIVRLALEDAGS